MNARRAIPWISSFAIGLVTTVAVIKFFDTTPERFSLMNAVLVFLSSGALCFIWLDYTLKTQYLRSDTPRAGHMAGPLSQSWGVLGLNQLRDLPDELLRIDVFQKVMDRPGPGGSFLLPGGGIARQDNQSRAVR